jgi:hypothetical protein
MSTVASPSGASRRQPPVPDGTAPPAIEPGAPASPGEALLEGVESPAAGRAGEESIHETAEDDRLERDRGRGAGDGEESARESSADDPTDSGRGADPDAAGLDAP